MTSLLVKLAIVLVVLILAVLEASGEISTFLQSGCAIPIAYALHFFGLRVPFRFLHAENAFLALLVLAGAFAAVGHGWAYTAAFSESWFAWVVIAIDELIITRHHLTRKGFRTIERPADISWVIGDNHVEAVRLLNSEEEDEFLDYCRSDMTTSVLAFAALFVGVLVRKFLQPQFFGSAS
jgi:hypothetical protein